MATRHCDAETLRALAHGALDSQQAAQARQHLGECQECSRALADLDPLAGETLEQRPRSATAGEVFLSSPGRMLERGTRVDRYVILERLGSGGMGEIYAAYDPQLDRKIALKLMRMDVLSTLGTHSGRVKLLAEAKALARLNHPNVVAVHDVGEVGDEIFIAMELVEGEVLREWLEATPRTTARVLEVFKMAGRGLAAAHAVGLVHRDFKPLNVIVGRDGRARVVDFGLARTATSTAETVPGRMSRVPAPPPAPPSPPSPVSLPHGDQTITVSSRAEVTLASLSGTPAYMAPEQLRAEPTDARTDQFSFAVALYEALCGHRPFQGDTVDVLLAAIERGPGPSRSLPAWLHAVLARALSPVREGRFPGMGELLEALEADPSLRRRQRWRMAGVALAAAAVLLGAVAARSSAQRRCAPPRARWDGLWDEARRAGLRQSFARTDRPFAAAASDAVERALDRYREDWLSMHQQACLATLDGAQPRDVLDLRTECLDRRLAGARALVDQLSRADEATVKNAALAAADLQPLSDCADEQALRAGAAWPLDPSRRAEVEALRAQVAEARALYSVGSLPAALEAATRAAASADAIGYKPLAAEAQLVLAQVYGQRQELPLAIAAEHRAAAAAQATGQLHLVEQAWTQLVRHSAVMGGEPAVWSTYAEALLGRLSGDTRPLRAALLRAEATAEVQRRQYQRARELGQRSLAVAEEAVGKEHPLAREALDIIATSAWYLGDLDLALATHERVLEIDRREKGKFHPSYAAHLRDMAGILLERGDFEESIKRATEAEASYSKSLPPENPQVIQCTYYRSQAMAHLEVERGQKLGAEALAREMLDKLIAVRGGQDNFTVSYSMALGIVLMIHGRCAEALPIFERAEAVLAPLATVAADQWDVQENRKNLGACLLAAGAPDRARTVLKQSVDWFAENGTRNVILGEGQFLLAQAEWRTGAKEEARQHAEAARAMLSGASARGRKLAPEVERWLAERGR